MSTHSLFDFGSRDSGYHAWLKSTYGGAYPDYATGGFAVKSVGPMAIESTGGTLTIGPTDSSATNIGTTNTTGAVNIGVLGSRLITIGGATSSITTKGYIFHIDGKILRQFSAIALPDSGTPTVDQLLSPTPVFKGSAPTGPTNFTLPTAAELVSKISNVAKDEFFGFTLVNTALLNAYTIVAGAGGSIVGDAVVAATKSGYFALAFDNVTSGSEQYTVYKMSGSN